MSGVATAPIYSVYSTYLDAGLTGGALLDFEGHAERAAAAAANLLMGRGPAVHGEAAVVPSRCVVDAGKARAFGLNLPGAACGLQAGG